ncbi:adenosylcobinamide amidohydrolase [Reyranella sp.]|uniref:adenosylcobinamide amidohydrolase n=1 Tax=Reyranella sp. TaxID=1929291 RepID=UPI003BAD3923
MAEAVAAARPEPPFAVHCAPPFLAVRFAEPQRTLGWSLLHPGFATITDIVWVEVRNADLGPSVDPQAFLRMRLRAAGRPEALGLMTSRDIRRHHLQSRRVDGIAAACLTTVGLANGERVGSRRSPGPHAGTINTLLHVATPLDDGALVEALSIAAQARTAALVDSCRGERATAITGTGTDCIVVAAPCHGPALACAGLHTAVGEAIGAAVYEATRHGAEEWDREFPHLAARR